MTTRIDVHAHLFPRRFVSEVEAHGVPFGFAGRPMRQTPELCDFDARVDELDLLGIDHQVLSLGPPGVDAAGRGESAALAALYNDELLAAVAARPDRFSALVHLPALDPAAALAELRRRVGTPGVVGIQLFTNAGGEHPDREALWPVYELAEDAGLPILLHPTTPACVEGMEEWGLTVALGLPFDTTLAASRLILSGTLDRFPRLRVVLVHGGGALALLASRIDAIAASAARVTAASGGHLDGAPSDRLRRFTVDTVLNDPRSLRMAIDTWGAGGVVLGTDYPYARFREAIDDVVALGLDGATEAAVLGGNAARLFRLPVS